MRHINYEEVRKGLESLDIKNGTKFHSVHFGSEVQVLWLNVEENILHVRIADKWEEDWDLECTVWGFHTCDYYFKKHE